MIALILTLIIIIATVAHFYLKFTPMRSLVAFLAVILGFVTAFSFYELLADLLISREYIAQMAQCLSFLVLFFATSAILGLALDFVAGSNIDFGQPIKISCAIGFGLLTGLIISGVIIIVLGLAPFRKSIPYARFGDSINTSDPSPALIPADAFVTGFYNLISKGALGTGNNFGVVHANFLDQIHLNRYAIEDKAVLVVSKDAAFVKKFGVRKKELPGGDVRTVIELYIKGKTIKKGGAVSDSAIVFSLAQTRLLCVPAGQQKITGKNLKVIYPEKYLIKGQPVKQDVQLSEVLSFSREDFITTSGGQAVRIDLAFVVPENLTPEFLQFKGNNTIKLPKLATQEEIDEAAQEEANKATEE